MDIKKEIIIQAKLARQVSRELVSISTEIKNNALLEMASELEGNTVKILKANKLDMESGKKKGLSKALLDRLELSDERIKNMATGLRELVQFEDPVGEFIKMWKRPNGLRIGQMRVPLGVIGIIYESRPNVTVDAAGLALKAGNAVILRGGSEAFHSNQVLTEIIAKAASNSGVPEGAIQLIQTVDRRAIEVMFNLNQYLDVLIPRGGAGLINRVIKDSKVPVIQTGVGNCHIYVDSAADLEMALKIVYNSKVSRPAVCNAAESLLVHKDVAKEFLPLLEELFTKAGVEIRGCEESQILLPSVKVALEEDWSREYLDYIISMKIVSDFDEAVEHINNYGTKHSEAIITDDYNRARIFLEQIDAAAVYVNASTRFTDGSQFGLGAEIGISTQKLHARGPMGLKELTTTKYIILGHGQIRK